MKVNAKTAALVLTAFIREDRSETRLYRARVQNAAWSLVVASFAITAFLVEKAALAPMLLRVLTLLTDLSLVAVMLIFFLRTQIDLVLLRKAMKARQDLLYELSEDKMDDINVFPDVRHVHPDIRDTDLKWLVWLSVAVVLVKMTVVIVFPITKAHI